MINEMKYVYAVYQEKSFSKAARKMFVSQPALSNMVKKAEAEIGRPIFDRSTIPLTVTKEGMYYIRSVEQIFQIQRNTENYFKDLQNLKGGTLSIGGSSFFCSFVLASLIGEFKRLHPAVSIDLLEGNIRELRRGIQEESLDLIIETALKTGEPGMDTWLYTEESIILAVPAEFEINKKFQPYRLTGNDLLAGNILKKEPVPLESFCNTPFIMMKPGNDMNGRGLQICRNAGFSPKISMQIDQVMTSFNIAAQGIGAVFIRDSIVKYMPEMEHLVYYRIGDPLARRQIFFGVKHGRYMSTAVREFLRLSGARKCGSGAEKQEG